MTGPTYAVAVVGATGLVGAEIIAVLDERGFPLRALRLYASDGSAGDEVSCGALTARVELLDQAEFDGVDIVFLAAGAPVSADVLERLSAAGAVAIDTSPYAIDEPDVPVIVPEVNAAEIHDYVVRHLVVSPDPIAIALAVVVRPLQAAATVRRLVVATFEPVSSAGRAGIEELQRQTVELMSGQSTEPAVFSQRIAFNALPQVGELVAEGGSRDEQHTVTALRRLLDLPDLPVSVTRVRIPTFFGTAIALNIETDEPLSVAHARELLRGAPGVLIDAGAEAPAYPTPASAVGQDAICVGRIRADEVMNVLDVWIAIDNLRKGAAVNAVQIAEVLVRAGL